MTKQRGPVALIIIDGWGYSASREGNAIALATTPFYDELCEKYPQTLLEAHGSRVGLPAGVMGNSEVGHLNIGSGRVIRMDVSLVDHEIETGEFFHNKVLVEAVDGAKTRGKALHLMGLISDGQVHSSLTHLYALLKIAKDHGLEQVYIHCFLDGRDTPPSSGTQYVAGLQRKLDEIGCGEIATVVGRYYAMDRDKRWERTQRAFELLTKAIGERALDPITAINESYAHGVTDEFVEPVAIVRKDGAPVATIKDDDSIIFFNFRPDRARQLTRALTVTDFNEFDVSDRPHVHFVCFTMYDHTFDLPIAFPPRHHRNVLAEAWGNLCVRNYRLAETEKYAHVTY
ncbi:MAG TPA: 2,3-bisphosphoglycerate-independent phosphoglycerate mutase, partial [Pyrinomonadaceae bacterium]|nr:2,3-bisphosphoglycerate-independent phosphoglycerate mutase [Pyrinomonadaceae bacterium]